MTRLHQLNREQRCETNAFISNMQRPLEISVYWQTVFGLSR